MGGEGREGKLRDLHVYMSRIKASKKKEFSNLYSK